MANWIETRRREEIVTFPKNFLFSGNHYQLHLQSWLAYPALYTSVSMPLQVIIVSLYIHLYLCHYKSIFQVELLKIRTTELKGSDYPMTVI